jgi:hypothetical protein
MMRVWRFSASETEGRNSTRRDLIPQYSPRDPSESQNTTVETITANEREKNKKEWSVAIYKEYNISSSQYQWSLVRRGLDFFLAM